MGTDENAAGAIAGAGKKTDFFWTSRKPAFKECSFPEGASHRVVSRRASVAIVTIGEAMVPKSVRPSALGNGDRQDRKRKRARPGSAGSTYTKCPTTLCAGRAR